MTVIEANDAVEKICSMSPRELIGKKMPPIYNQCNNACENILRETLKSQTTIRDTRIDCGQLENVHQVVSVTSSPLINKNNESIGAVLVVRDVTRLNDLENELRERHQFHNIIGKSSKMQGIYRLLEDLAQTDTTVLITGESGVLGRSLSQRLFITAAPGHSSPWSL